MATTQDVKRFMEYRKRCPTAQEYYEKRGISSDLIDEFHLGFCPLNKDHWAKGRIIVPVFDCYGRFLDFAGRKSEMKTAALNGRMALLHLLL